MKKVKVFEKLMNREPLVFGQNAWSSRLKAHLSLPGWAFKRLGPGFRP